MNPRRASLRFRSPLKLVFLGVVCQWLAIQSRTSIEILPIRIRWRKLIPAVPRGCSIGRSTVRISLNSNGFGSGSETLRRRR
jgi:hypothetical protein